MKSALTLASLFLSSISAFASCSGPSTPCEWYAVHHGQPTFVGMAVSEETVSDVLALGDYVTPVTVQKVTFRVEEPFESTPSKTVAIYGSGTTNDLRFKVGVRYLVYGFRGKDGKIRTGKCTRTAPVTEAAEDLTFLRSLRTRVGGGIRGLVRFVSPGTQTGTVTGTVTESGSDGDRKTRVAASGWYELKGLAPGDYRETFTPDDNSTEFMSLRLSIPVNGSCVESGVRLGNVTVSGSVSDETGIAISGAEVFLFYALDGRLHPDVALKTRADADCKFSFHCVEAAKYILSAQLASSEMIFFPGTPDASKTEIIEVYDGKPLSGLAVRVPRSSQSKWAVKPNDWREIPITLIDTDFGEEKAQACDNAVFDKLETGITQIKLETTSARKYFPFAGNPGGVASGRRRARSGKAEYAMLRWLPNILLNFSETMNLHQGDQLGHYQIESLVARSGMASIFRATDRRNGQPVAIKFPHEEMENDSVFYERFMRRI